MDAVVNAAKVIADIDSACENLVDCESVLRRLQTHLMSLESQKHGLKNYGANSCRQAVMPSIEKDDSIDEIRRRLASLTTSSVDVLIAVASPAVFETVRSDVNGICSHHYDQQLRKIGHDDKRAQQDNGRAQRAYETVHSIIQNLRHSLTPNAPKATHIASGELFFTSQSRIRKLFFAPNYRWLYTLEGQSLYRFDLSSSLFPKREVAIGAFDATVGPRGTLFVSSIHCKAVMQCEMIGNQDGMTTEGLQSLAATERFEPFARPWATTKLFGSSGGLFVSNPGTEHIGSCGLLWDATLESVKQNVLHNVKMVSLSSDGRVGAYTTDQVFGTMDVIRGGVKLRALEGLSLTPEFRWPSMSPDGSTCALNYATEVHFWWRPDPHSQGADSRINDDSFQSAQKHVLQQPQSNGVVVGTAYSPDGRYYAIVGSLGYVTLLSVHKRELAKVHDFSIPGCPRFSNCVTGDSTVGWTPDGQFLAICLDERGAVLIHVERYLPIAV